MPDPADPTPVRVQQRGSGYVVVDKDGRTLPGQSATTLEAAQALAAQVNKTWAGVKKERLGKGAPAITREARVEERADRFRRILGA